MRISAKSLSQGLGKLASSILGGQDAFQQGEDYGATAQSRIGQALASMRAHDANAGLHKQKALGEAQEQQIIAGRPDEADLLMAAQANTDVPTIRAYRQQLLSGTKPTTSATGDPETDAMIGIKQQPVISSELVKALVPLMKQFAPYRTNVKDMAPEGLAKADETYRDQAQQQQVLDGNLSPIALALANMAQKGAPAYNFYEYGVGNNFTGAMDATGQPAQNFGKFRQAATDENAAQGRNADAGAMAHRAAAGASSARAGLYGEQKKGAVIDNGMSALDFEAGKSGKPLPSSNKIRGTSGEDATIAKARGRVIQDIIKNAGTSALKNPEKLQKLVDNALTAGGFDPVDRGELATLSVQSAPTKPDSKGKALDMNAANKIKADFQSGNLTNEQAKAKLLGLGFK